jgi:proteic killer suppression protein
MIKTFADKRTAQFHDGKRVPAFQAIEKQAKRRLGILNDAERIEDLMALPANRFEALGGDLSAFYSIRVNDKWRIVFRFHDGDAYDVEITDYH